jgi:hypothetical protein
VRCGPAGEGAGAMGPLVAFRVGLSRRGDVARGLRPTTTKQGCAAHATERGRGEHVVQAYYAAVVLWQRRGLRDVVNGRTEYVVKRDNVICGTFF